MTRGLLRSVAARGGDKRIVPNQLRRAAITAGCAAALAIGPLVAATPAGALAPGVATSVQAPAAASGSVGPALDTGYGVEVNAAGTDQCGRPVSGRVGRWVCPDAGAVPQVAAAAGKCLAVGCWYRQDDFHSSFAGRAFYGFGKKTLGRTTNDFKIGLNGAQSRSDPVHFKSTAAVNNLIISGERFYSSPAHPECHQDNPSTFRDKDFGHVAANHTVGWKYNGFEKTVHVAAVVHEWKFNVHGYPGTWFLIIKSIRFHKISGGRYKFGSATDLCKTPSIAGYHP